MSNGGVYWTDANVLLRFLTDEPPELAARAAKLLEADRVSVAVLHSATIKPLDEATIVREAGATAERMTGS